MSRSKFGMNRQALFGVLMTVGFISCQQVNIERNEVGVHFKKFDGGVDTTGFLDTGNHTIGSWDKVVKYCTSIQSSSVEYLSKNNNQYIVSYTYRLPKENAPLYHNYVGGNPRHYSEKAINEIVSNGGIESLYEQSKLGRNEIFRDALNNYYIELNSVQIIIQEK